METKTVKTFDSVSFFRAIKEKLAKKMEGMTLKERKEFLQQVREGKIKVA
jgi:lipopolysaccharide export system protein LptC